MTQPPPNKPFVMDQAHLRRARNLARESGRTVIAELEHLNNGTSQDLVQQLARLFGMAAVDRVGLLALAPAFDLLPLALARCWQCMLFREADGALVGVIADPFDPDLQLWLNGQAHGAVLMRLASGADLQSYLNKSSDEDVGGATRPTAGKASVGADPANPAADGATDPAATADTIAMANDILRRAMRR